MTAHELAEREEIRPIVLGEKREIANVFCGDLLSWAMGKVRPGACWCTVMANLNTLAVASLADVACVLLCEGSECPADMETRAGEIGISLLAADLPEFEAGLLTARLAGLL